jgi:pilus assembly protein CpaE
MLSLAILASSSALCAELEDVAESSGIFRLVLRVAPFTSVQEILRMLRTQDPEVVILDVSNWDAVSLLASKIKETGLNAVVVGVGYQGGKAEQLEFENVGILDILQYPVSSNQLEGKVYDALHRVTPSLHPNLLAFLPAKAGSGASTIALNTAAALVKSDGSDTLKRVLLIEADRRSGGLSILLNIKDNPGLTNALNMSGEMTPLEWTRSIVPIANIHLLAANPGRRGPMQSWAEYFQLLRFAHDRYDYIIVDLPEVINDATRELVRAARATFITCTAELPSLAMASLRSADLDTAEIPADKVKILVNRYERSALTMDQIQEILGRPVFATLPNDYREIKKAIMGARLVSSSSSFASGCRELARKIIGLSQSTPLPSKFSLLRKLSLLGG